MHERPCSDAVPPRQDLLLVVARGGGGDGAAVVRWGPDGLTSDAAGGPARLPLDDDTPAPAVLAFLHAALDRAG